MDLREGRERRRSEIGGHGDLGLVRLRHATGGPPSSRDGVAGAVGQDRQPARLPALAEVKAAVQRDLLRARAEQSGETFYQSLRQRYAVRVEAVPEMALDNGKVGSLAKAN